MQASKFHYSFLLYFLSISLIMWSGCKDDSSPSGPTGNKPEIVSFTATPSSISAAGDSVTFSWQVNNADTLTISPGIGKVTPTTSGSKKVFVSSPGNYTLKATNNAGSVESVANIAAALTISVNGYVKDVDGEPIAGVTVIIKGKSPAITGANGSFSIADVSSPYEIRLILSTQQTVVVFQGLTRVDPVLVYTSATTNLKTATISGTVPQAAGKMTKVFFVSGNKCWSEYANANTGTYSISLGWTGSANSYTGKLQVLRWTTNANGLPAAYDAYGSKDLTISAGGTFGGKDFAGTDLTDPAEQNISGSITRPNSSYNLTTKSLYLNIGNAFTHIASESGNALTDNFSYAVPTISGFTYEVDVYSEISAQPTPRYSRYWKTGITGGSTGISIQLETAPQLNLPAHNGTAIDTTTQFLWAQGSGTGINVISLMPQVMGPRFLIYTAGNTTTIPNLSPQGLGLPVNVQYSWQVLKYFPLSSINDVASQFYIPFITGNGGETGMTSSETFKFNTK